MTEKTPEQIARSERYKKYYDKFRKPKKTEEEKLKIIEERKMKALEYAKNYHKKTYIKKHIPKTEEEKKAKRIEYAKKYYDKININRVIKPRVKKEKNDVVLHRKEVIREVNYIDNIELLYNIILSQGQGKLNSIAFKLLMKIVEQVSRKFIYRCNEDREDIIQSGKLKLLESWMKFNSDKYTNCLAYYTELAKRSMSFQFNVLRGKHNQHQELPKMISLSKWNQ